MNEEVVSRPDGEREERLTVIVDARQGDGGAAIGQRIIEEES